MNLRALRLIRLKKKRNVRIDGVTNSFERRTSNVPGWLVIPMIIFITWRLSSGKRVFVKEQAKQELGLIKISPGAGSEF